jgi:hypothetical protein
MLNLPAGKPDLGAGLGRAAGMRQQQPHGLHIAGVTEFAEFAGEGPTAAEGCRCGLSAMRFWRLACSLSEFEKVRAAINTWRTPCSRPMLRRRLAAACWRIPVSWGGFIPVGNKCMTAITGGGVGEHRNGTQSERQAQHQVHQFLLVRPTPPMNIQ